MKLLFDQNPSFNLCHLLSDLFPASEQVGRLGLANASDQQVWAHAQVHGFALVSQDADFADLVALDGPPPKVIWLRCGNQRTVFVADLLRRRSEAIATFGRDDRLACLEIY